MWGVMQEMKECPRKKMVDYGENPPCSEEVLK